MQELIQTDKDIFLFLNQLGSSSYDQFWILISEKWIWVPLYVMFLYFLAKAYSARSLLYIILFIILGIIASDQTSNIFKYGVERLRPCHDESLKNLMRQVQCGGNFGFYSAHASNTFFIATFIYRMLRHKIKFLGITLFTWASIVSFSRIYLGVHFPLDVIYGACVGFLIGGFFSTLAIKTCKR